MGKSTILETLGLMNNTIYSKSNTVFDFFGFSAKENRVKKENMMNIWNKERAIFLNLERITLVYFQSTNLFANLNAEDNALLTPMYNL